MERRLAYQKAVELNRESAPAQAGAAMTLTSQGQAKEALAFANRALDLEPWNPGMVEALATAAHGLGRCEEALQLAIEDLRKPARGVQRDLLDQFPAPRQRDAAMFAGGIHRQDQRYHWLRDSARSIAYTFPLAFMP